MAPSANHSVAQGPSNSSQEGGGTFTLPLPDEAATEALGRALAQGIASQTNVRLYLRGDVGAGKTTLARALLRALGHTGRVKSPTYTLVELYNFSSYDVQHFDLYRISDPREWHDAGFDECLDAPSLKLIEWPDKAAAALPLPDVSVELQLTETPHLPATRIAQLTAYSPLGKQCLLAAHALLD
jgi:tRNA threonylcarbamoyladenosine biosynthesis protein TsaE